VSVDIDEVIALIHERIAEIHYATDVARLANVNYHTLRSVFRRHVDASLGEYLSDVRIHKAKVLLCDSELRCFEIAYAVGFRREDSAAHIFKKHTGLTMEEYRQNFASGGVPDP